MQWEKISKQYQGEVFTVFWKEVLPLSRCDGMWIAPLFDHFISVRIKIAVLADDQIRVLKMT
jgi:hypothetical protein